MNRSDVVILLIAVLLCSSGAALAAFAVTKMSTSPNNPTPLPSTPNASNATAVAPLALTSPPPRAHEWMFIVHANAPTGTARGSVDVFLTATNLTANATVAQNLSVEVAAVSWNPLNITSKGTNILSSLNDQLQREPPVNYAKSVVSQTGNGVELAFTPEMRVRGVLVYAPGSSEFLILDWPSGQAYAWNAHANDWERNTDSFPSIPADDISGDPRTVNGR